MCISLYICLSMRMYMRIIKYMYTYVGKLLNNQHDFPLTSGFPDQYTRIPGTSLLVPM